MIRVSTGSPQAFEQIFPGLKHDFSIPIVCPQYISHGFINSMITWLGSISNLKFEAAQAESLPMPEHVYFPLERIHLTFAHNGVQGMKAIFDEGGDTIAQDEESCVIFGMPAAAIELGVICEVLSAADIAHYLNQLPSLRVLSGS